MRQSCDDFLREMDPTLKLNPEFRREARYDPRMDMLLYLDEDCGYVCERVDRILSVLWDYRHRTVVGIKLKGFRWIFNQIQSELNLQENDFLPLVQLLEAVVTKIMLGAMDKSKSQRYELAFTAARRVRVSRQELLAASK